MSSYVPEMFDWMMLGVALQWGKALAAGYLGLRVVRAYERRGPTGEGDAASDARRPHRALRRRMARLESTVEVLEAQTRQSLDAQRFTTALLTGDRAGARSDARERSMTRAATRAATPGGGVVTWRDQRTR